jgi:hypothetical protein
MTGQTRRRAVAATTTAAVTAATVVVLQVLQQSIGAFNPTPVISDLIVVAAFFAGLAAARAGSRRALSAAFEARNRTLRRLVGVWPAPQVGQADPIRLGVLPARREFGPKPPYVSRRIDRDLRAALLDGDIVVVLGDARAGASRTAFEAALHELKEAPVVAPRSASALSELLALDPPLKLSADHALVWLDGIDRYIEAIDATTLGMLQEIAAKVTVLVTARRADWNALLEATSPGQKPARAVLAQARVFELPGQLDGSELAESERLYPGMDISAGIGVTIATTGRETSPPARRPDEHGLEGEPDPNGPARKDPLLILPAAATLAAVIGFVAVWQVSGFSTPSISDQLAAIKRDGSSGGRHVEQLTAADLHGGGTRSYVLLFAPKPNAASPKSDELRVYDQHGDKLVPALRFQPSGRRAVFQYRADSDVDFDGAAEIVGGYGYANEARGAMVPFAIDWNDAENRYRLVTLDMGAPKLSQRATSIPEAQYRAIYNRPTTFTDANEHITISGYRVQDFAVTPAPHRLVAGWFLQPWLGSKKATFELHAAILDSSTGAPHVTPCRLTGLNHPLIVSSTQARLPMDVFEEAYAMASAGRYCAPVSLG